MKTTGLIAIVFGYHKKIPTNPWSVDWKFCKKTRISGDRIGRSESEWRKILYRIGNRIGHFFGIGTPLVDNYLTVPRPCLVDIYLTFFSKKLYRYTFTETPLFFIESLLCFLKIEIIK